LRRGLPDLCDSSAMTIINITHKFIFVHIPKTAGTATKAYFRQFARNCDIEAGGPHDENMLAQEFAREIRLMKHSRARDIMNIIGDDVFSRYFSFSIVRNPFTRTVSAFTFLKHNFREWGESHVMEQFSTVEEFVTSDFFQQPGPDRMLEPQAIWLFDKDDAPLVKHVGHIESLESELISSAEKLGLPPPVESLEKRNVSKRKGSIDTEYALTPIVREIILERYKRDFELLDYPTDPPGELLGVGNWIIETADS
jgi:hypothetical protein